MNAPTIFPARPSRPFPFKTGQDQLDRYRRTMDYLGVEVAEDYFAYNIANTVAMVAGATQIFSINIERDSAFEWIATSGGATSANHAAPDPTLAPVSVTIIDSASSRNLMNRAVPLLNFCGNGETPFVNPIARRFMPATQVTFAVNNSGANTIPIGGFSLTLHGRKLFMRAGPGMRLERFVKWTDVSGQLYSEDFFVYDQQFPALAPGTSSTQYLLFENDSHFEWIMTTLSAVDANGNLTGAAGNDFSLLIADGNTGRQLFNQPLPASDISGIGTFPFVNTQPRIWLAKGQAKITLTNNNSGEIASTVDFSMIGRKIFELG